MNCKRCGTELKNDDEFCYRCGQRTTVFQRMFASRAFYGSLAAILVVAAVAVLAWFIWTGRLSLPIGGGSGAAGAPQGEDTAAAPEKTEAPHDRTAEPTATPYVFQPPLIMKTAPTRSDGATVRPPSWRFTTCTRWRVQ